MKPTSKIMRLHDDTDTGQIQIKS